MSKKNKKPNYDPVKCPKCSRVYVMQNKSIDTKVGLSYLSHFPSYGLEKIMCDECKENKNETKG